MNTLISDRPITFENTEKDACIRLLLNALLETHDLLTGGWIEPRSIRIAVMTAEDALRQTKESGLIKKADWPKFIIKTK